MEQQQPGDSSKPCWWETRSLAPFRPNSSICVSGYTGSGKDALGVQTTQTFTRNVRGIPPPMTVLYCYGVYQPLFDTMENEELNLKFHQNPPTQTDIEELTEDGKHHLLILDDLMAEVAASKKPCKTSFLPVLSSPQC